MAAVISAHGRTTQVRLSPMAPLRTIMETGLAQLGLKNVDPAACQMTFNGKPLDLSLPTRFANIPPGSKLVVITGHERKLGVQDAPPTEARLDLPKGEERRDLVSRAVDATKEPTTMIPTQPLGQSPPQLTGGKPASDAEGSREQEATTSRAIASNPVPASSRARNSEGSEPTAADSQTEFLIPSTSRGQEHPSHAIFGRTVYVFHRSVESSSSDIVSREDVPDEFYEFTETDLQRVMAGYAASRAREAASATLKTKELRDREARAKEESQADQPAHIIVELPDGCCLQTSFRGRDSLALLHNLVERALLPDLSDRFSLFLTPPKTPIRTRGSDVTLSAAGLLPAARLHVSLPSGTTADSPQKGPVVLGTHLRREVVALLQQTPPPSVFHSEGQKADDAQIEGGPSGSSTNGSGKNPVTTTVPHSTPRAGSGGGKAPKWLKLSRR